MEESDRLQHLKSEFNSKYQRSLNKEVLLNREIEAYDLIFNEKKLQVDHTANCPLESYSIDYSNQDIFLIRQYYIHFIVDGNDISEIARDEWNSWSRRLIDTFLEDLYDPYLYYHLAYDLFEYLKWLKYLSRDTVTASTLSVSHNQTIVDQLYIRLLFKKYGGKFTHEDELSWLDRFIRDDQPREPIAVEKAAREKSSRRTLIAILASIQATTGNMFNFQEFVKTNFGIRNFEVTKNRIRDTEEFKIITHECKRILKM